MQGVLLTEFDFQALKSEITTTVVDEVVKKLTPLLSGASEDEILSRRKAAQFLGISLPTLHVYTMTGVVQGYRMGNTVRYRKTELQQALKSVKTKSIKA
jgi:excisionase family DNA binding protein